MNMSYLREMIHYQDLQIDSVSIVRIVEYSQEMWDLILAIHREDSDGQLKVSNRELDEIAACEGWSIQ